MKFDQIGSFQGINHINGEILSFELILILFFLQDYFICLYEVITISDE